MVRALDVSTNIDDFLKDVDAARLDQVPYAMSLAMNWSIEEAKVEVQQEMQRVFDRPTDFTLNSPDTHWSTKRELVATLTIKDWGTPGSSPTPAGSIQPGKTNKGTPAAAYLEPQIEGGTRRHKAMERALFRVGVLPQGWFAVPAREVPLDAYGNVPHGFVIRMLSDLRAFQEDGSGYRANRKAGRRKGARAANAFFAVRPGSNFNRHLKPGIYWRLNKMLICVFVFVSKVNYQKRLDFQGVAERAAVAAFQRHWPNAWAQALATDRNRGRLIKVA